MSLRKYKRDSYSGALILADTRAAEEFMEKKKTETQIKDLEIEIHTLKAQLEEVLKFVHNIQETSKCQ